MILGLHGHIGSKATALVDGQLSPAEEERAWNHVLGCPGCRRLVQHEGSVKRRLAGLNGPEEPTAPAYLVGNLYAVDAWTTVDEIERRSVRRRSVAVLVGAGSIGVAVLAIMSAPSTGSGELPGRGPTVGPARIGQVPARVGPTGGSGVGRSLDVGDVVERGGSR